MWSKRIIIIRYERVRCEIFWQLQLQFLMVRYLIINNCHQIPKLVILARIWAQPRLAVVTTYTIIAVMVHCYLGFNSLSCWFTRIVNIFENAYIIWVCKTLSKCNIFSDVFWTLFLGQETLEQKKILVRISAADPARLTRRIKLPGLATRRIFQEAPFTSPYLLTRILHHIHPSSFGRHFSFK